MKISVKTVLSIPLLVGILAGSLYGQGPFKELLPKELREEIAKQYIGVTIGHEFRPYSHISGDTNVEVVQFSPDGKNLLTGSKSVRLWDTKTGKELTTFEEHKGYVSSLAFSPDGNTIFSGSNEGIISLWDSKTGQKIQEFQGHSREISSGTFSPDGTTILTCGFWDGIARLWDLTGKELQKFEPNASIVSVAFSSDGNSVFAGCGNGKIVQWDVQTGQKIQEFNLPGGSDIFSLQLRPDKDSIITGSNKGVISLWNIKTGQNLLRFQDNERSISSVALSPDGTSILTVSSNAHLWDLKGNLLQAFTEYTNPMSGVFSPGGHYIALTIPGRGVYVLGRISKEIEKASQAKVLPLLTSPND